MIVEFELDVDTLRQPLAAAPGMRVDVEHVDGAVDVPLRTLFWARGGDFDAFERALDGDPDHTNYRRLATSDGERLYRTRYDDDYPGTEAYRHSVELDAILLSAASRGETWDVRMRFPDRDSFRDWSHHLEERGRAVTVTAVYDQPDSPAETDTHGLTPEQYEAMIVAVESGYFAIPRTTSLSGVAEQLGVSSQAASERLRRATERLASATFDVERET